MTDSQQKYGLVTAISMVVGSVIGSGVFFKAEDINLITGGHFFIAISAWSIGAAVMILCLLSFALIARKGSTEGIFAMSKTALGCKYAHYVGWFAAVVYYPSVVSVLAFLSARYTLITLGAAVTPFSSLILSLFYLTSSFLLSALSPKLSGRVQIIATFLKLIPLVLMIVLGISKGASTGILFENIAGRNSISSKNTLFSATTATLFAYEGWISTISVGKDLKNGRRNLPIALLIGGVIISAVYILYYLGIMGAVSSETLVNYGADGIRIAFANILGRWGSLLTAFVAISCLGALNALVMGFGRLANEFFSKTPRRSFWICLITSSAWLFYLLGEQGNVLGKFQFDSTELPVVTIYALYIPIFFKFAKKEKSIKAIILYTGGICASAFALFCGALAHMHELLSYAMVLTGIMLFGSLFRKKTG